MKKIYTTALIMLTSFICFGRTKRSLEVEVAESLKIAIPLLIVGFLIAYIFMWSKKDKSKISNESTNVGCLGVIIMAVGAFFLLPLLVWVLVNVVTIGFAIVVVGVIIFLIYSALTNNNSSSSSSSSSSKHSSYVDYDRHSSYDDDDRYSSYDDDDRYSSYDDDDRYSSYDDDDRYLDLDDRDLDPDNYEEYTDE